MASSVQLNTKIKGEIDYLEGIQKDRKEWKDSWIGFDTMEKIKGVIALCLGMKAADFGAILWLFSLIPLIRRQAISDHHTQLLSIRLIALNLLGRQPSFSPPPASNHLSSYSVRLLLLVSTLRTVGTILFGASCIYAYNRFTLPQDDVITAKIEALKNVLKEG